MARTVRERPPLWSLLFIVPGSFLLAPTLATWLGLLIVVLAGPNSSLVWFYASFILPVRFALLLLLSVTGLKLWQYLAALEARGAANEGVPLFPVKPARRPPVLCWLLLLTSLFISLLLRTFALGQSFTYNELFALQNFIHLPSLDKVTMASANPSNHFLYSVLVWILARFLGEGEIALRLPAVIFGIAGVYAIFALARELFGWREGIISSFLLAFSLWHIYYSQEGRGYSAAVFFAIAATYFMVKGLERNTVRTWLVYIVCLVLGLYSSLSFSVVAVAQLGLVAHSGASLGYRKLRMRGLRAFSMAWLVTIGSGLALYAPALKSIAANVTLLMGREIVGFENIITAYLAALGDIVAWASGDRGVFSGLAILALAAVGLARLGRQDGMEGTKRLFLWVAAAGMGAMLPLVARHFFFSHLFIVMLPFITLAVAKGVTSLAERLGAEGYAVDDRGRSEAGPATIASWLRMHSRRYRIQTLAAVGIVFALLAAQANGLWTYYQNSKQDIRGVARYLMEEATPEDMVVVAGLGWREFSHYYRRPVHHPASLQELSRIAAKEQPSAVYFVVLFGPEDKGPLPRWAGSNASVVKHFPPVKQGLPLTTIQVLKVQTPLVISP